VWRLGVYAENGGWVKTASWDGGIFCGPGEQFDTEPRAFPSAITSTSNPAGQVSVAAGTSVVLATFKNTSTVLGESLLTSYKFTVIPPAAGGGQVIAQIVANPTLSGTPDYVSNGVMSICHTAGVGARTAAPVPITISNGSPLITETHDYAKSLSGAPTNVDGSALGLVAYPDDEFAIVVTNLTGGTTVTVYYSCTWKDKV
jgi:hypothetical protein